MKTVKRNEKQGNFYAYLIKCPACKSPHVIDGRWKFNNNYDKPTFTPSLKVSHPAHPEDNIKEFICHSFITDGKIQFLGDCTHELKNSIVELPEIDEDYYNG